MNSAGTATQPLRKRHQKWFMVIFAVAVIGVGIYLLYVLEPYYRTDASLLFAFLMGYTSAIIILSPLVFPYGKFTHSVVLGSEATTLMGIDAGVIVGALFFLQIVPLGSAFDPGAGNNSTETISPYELRNLNSSQVRVLLANLTALTIIPFAFSAIVIAIWGDKPFLKPYKAPPLLKLPAFDPNPQKVTGTKLGTTFMISGFTWLIITMVILVYIIR